MSTSSVVNETTNANFLAQTSIWEHTFFLIESNGCHLLICSIIIVLLDDNLFSQISICDRICSLLTLKAFIVSIRMGIPTFFYCRAPQLVQKCSYIYIVKHVDYCSLGCTRTHTKTSSGISGPS